VESYLTKIPLERDLFFSSLAISRSSNCTAREEKPGVWWHRAGMIGRIDDELEFAIVLEHLIERHTLGLFRAQRINCETNYRIGDPLLCFGGGCVHDGEGGPYAARAAPTA
jgi:hypothetical protein